MARARNIKPGLFKNEILVEFPAFVRLMFVGLWTLADREGRLEDRPKRIKLELFPYDTEDAHEALQLLADNGFIERYEADGKMVIQIVNFLKHQTPHGTERDSLLPCKDGYYTVHERNKAGYATGNKRRNNVKSSENNVQSQDNTESALGGKRPDSPIHRFTDSPNISSSLRSEDKRVSRFDAQAHLVGMGVDASIAADWVQHRKALKAAPSLTAIDGIAKESERAGISLSDALAMCCQRGWRGFKAEWIADAPKAKTYASQKQEADIAYMRSIGLAPPVERLIQGEVL